MEQPNVVMIVTDDQRFDTIRALGNPVINTPNLDQLVADGFSFEKHFCTTPICTPARAEILTGHHTFHNRVPWFEMPIDPRLELLPRIFGKNGFHTMHVGKWHNDGHPRDKGYDITRCVIPADNLNRGRGHGHNVRFQDGDSERAGHSTEVFTEAAIDAIHQAPDAKPWFLYLAYTAPHDPHHSPEPFASMYEPQTIPLPPDYMPEHPFDNGDMVIRDELLENWPRTPAVIRNYIARYYGMISHLDWNIGRLLGDLRARGEFENTVVCFTGDQGLAVGSHGLLGKESMYDHSVASPLILSGPGVPAGGRSRSMSHHVDLLPTICELAGIGSSVTGGDGFSLVPVLQGRLPRVRDEVFCQFYSPEEPDSPLRHTQRAVRTEQWKLTWYPLSNRFQLFDLVHDAHELVDLLAPWRVRRRIAETTGETLWQKDPWAALDLAVPYRHSEIESLLKDLHGRLCDLMTDHGDPLTPPPEPALQDLSGKQSSLN